MSETINIEGEIGALEREYAARRAELEELAAAQRRAVEQSEWMAQKRAAEAAVEAARVAKLDAWRNGALAVAATRYAALRAAYIISGTVENEKNHLAIMLSGFFVGL